jgi:hypothetical protein
MERLGGAAEVPVLGRAGDGLDELPNHSLSRRPDGSTRDHASDETGST